MESPWPRTFRVQVYKAGELVRSARTAERSLEVAGLEAGALYGVRTSYQACGASVTATLAVRTGKGTQRCACYLWSPLAPLHPILPAGLTLTPGGMRSVGSPSFWFAGLRKQSEWGGMQCSRKGSDLHALKDLFLHRILRAESV